MDAISIAVPTPLAKTRDPGHELRASPRRRRDRAQRCIRDCSSCSRARRIPGTTRELMQPAARGARDSRWVRTSSSRSAPSASIRAIRCGTRRTRRRSSAASPPRAPRSRRRSTQRASTRIVPVSSTETAELVKLLENTFRSVNIGLVNEMAIVCDKLGVERVGGDRRRGDEAVRLHEVHARARASAGTAFRSIRTISRGRCARSTTRRASSTWRARSTREMPAFVVEQGRAGAERPSESR